MKGASSAFLATALVTTCKARCPNDYLKFNGLLLGNEGCKRSAYGTDPQYAYDDLNINDERIEWHLREAPLKICALFDSQERCGSRGGLSDHGTP